MLQIFPQCNADEMMIAHLTKLANQMNVSILVHTLSVAAGPSVRLRDTRESVSALKACKAIHLYPAQK